MEHKAQRVGKLISFLREEMGVSARAAQRLAKDQRLRVNHSTARLYQPIKVGDIQSNFFRSKRKPLCVPEEGELSVLYEDDVYFAAR
jgi:23S rRNA-/tRNA-specific pseudouridylate synthase